MASNFSSRILAAFFCLCFLLGFAPAALAEGVIIEADSTEVIVNDTLPLSVSGATEAVTWESNNTAVATVDSSGVVTGIAAGTVEITATTEDDSDSITITVKEDDSSVAVTGVTINKSTLSLSVGGEETLTATVAPAGATNQTISWKSSNVAVATVSSSGKVVGVSGGDATITVTTEDGDKTATCVVTVSATAPSINNTSATISVGSTKTLSISNLPSGATVAWSTASTSIATISSSSGSSTTVTGKAAGTTTVTAIITYSGGSTSTFSCSVKVESSSASTINYSVASNETLTFNRSDFNSASSSVNGYGLDYVKFTLPSSNYGVLYYDYDDGSYGHKVTDTKSYYYTGNSSKDYLNRVTFVPKSSYSGSFTMEYTGVDSNKGSFSGTIKITVKASNSDELTFSISKDTVLTFENTDFNTYCKSETGSNFDYIKFTSLPSSSKGVLYLDYSRNSSSNTNVTTSKSYYRNSSSPYLSDVSFVPASGYTGTVTIPFTGKSTGGTSFSGTITIKVGKSSGDIEYSASAGAVVTFDASDFNGFSKDETGANFDYIQFALPASSKGTLYLDYDSGTSNNTKVTASKSYYRSKTPYLKDITFVPASSSAGTTTISFTGKSVDGDNFSGTVAIVYKTVGNASTIQYTSNGGAVTFNKSDFISACDNRGGGVLSSVKFSLPSTSYGILYYGYSSASSYAGLVSSSTAYDTGSGTSSISNVTFVPSSGFSGTATISYTGTDADNASYTGTISILVTQTSVFTDMGNHGWAKEAVESLYQRGITSGTTKTTFNPGGNITRGDFILMLYRAFDLSAASGDNFSDVSSGAYYAEAVSAAKALGIAQGGSDGKFRPTESLTRQDAMVLIYRAMEKTGRGISGDVSNLSKFADQADISGYAQEAVAALAAKGIVTGDNNSKMNPTKSLTRAEMAVILYRVLAL